VAARLEKAARVYLVAEGKLSNVPWPELPCGKGRMIDRFQLGFAASLTHFAEASAKRSLFKRSFLACGEISNLKFQISNVTHLSGDAATTEAFLTKAGDHHVVHVNNPLVLRPDFPLESYVSFRAAGRQLGRLHAVEAFRLNAAGSLVTFASASLEGASSPSANSSAAGLLTTAFTFGGFPSILLADASDPELMASFYAALPKTSVGDALRQAQLDAAKKRPESKAWTRFRLYGHLGFGEEEGLEFADANYKDYLGKAAAAIKAKQWADVVRYCENALVLLDILDLAEHRDRLYGALVDACYNLKDYPKAIRYQAEVVKLAEQGKDVARLAEACRVLGVLQLRADDYKASVASLKRAVEIYQKNNLTEAAIDALAELGRAQESGTKYADALQSFRASLDMSREMKKERSAGDQLRRLGRVYYLRLSNYVEAEEYFRQALAVFQRLGDQKNVVETTLEIGLVHEKLADFREAAKYYQSGLELAQRGNDKLGQCKALIFLANTAWFQGDYHNAFKFTRASEALAKEIGSKPQQVIALNTLGLIFWTQNDYEASLKALDQALKLAAEIELKNEVASTHNNIGLVYREDKRYKEALDHFSQALALDTELDSKWGKAYDHRNMGMTYLRMGESDRALKALLESAQISQEIGEGTNLTKALFSIGDAYFEKGDLDNAVKHFGQALELAQRLNIRETEW
ncbi:MAG: tetratricopeptide repeat protein, partial [Planctomycetes bacterium]|nr:tetratricopeptide repeat protein [Planctomycetota bacterium]